MTRLSRLLPLVLAACTVAAHSQAPATSPAKPAAPPATPYYIDPVLLTSPALIPDPPAMSSSQQQAELAELHAIEQSRTPDQVAAAKLDAVTENMFAFRTVLGPSFTPEAFPLTAALGNRVLHDEGLVAGLLKSNFSRPRPYQTDATLHPVCPITQVHKSYPSGHTLTGYVEGLTLAELLPDQRSAILARAADFAHNRLVCGVHYPSDLEGGRRLAYLVFGYMLSSPKFQQDLAAARAELQSKLPSDTSHQPAATTSSH